MIYIIIALVIVVIILGGILSIFIFMGLKKKKGFPFLNVQDTDIKDIKKEQSILTEGVLACLKGLKEQGCDGPVTEAINKIEKHIIKQAHK